MCDASVKSICKSVALHTKCHHTWKETHSHTHTGYNGDMYIHQQRNILWHLIIFKTHKPFEYGLQTDFSLNHVYESAKTCLCSSKSHMSHFPVSSLVVFVRKGFLMCGDD